MEDAAKEEPAPRKVAQGKAGWMKKAHRRFLSSYKERYVSVEKTEVLVYENEEQKNCLERVDLENYDKCHELKSPFTKKHRLVVIRSRTSGNKVHDLKFQAQSAEEKEAWIKALSDAINRAKNKIFDELKVDEGSNLEHVTRSRPKGNRSRRPPTRIHMKGVADVSSDGILRLDLDLENAVMPNGATAVDGATESHKETITVPSLASGDTAEVKTLSSIKEDDGEEPTEKKDVKPPMPPSKDAKLASTVNKKTEEEEVVKPPMPPSKEVKICVTEADKTPETSPDSKKKSPPMPPSKPIPLITSSPPSPSRTSAPSPPSKDKKPPTFSEPAQETHQNNKKEDDAEMEDGEKTKESDNKVTPATEAHTKTASLEEKDCPKSNVPKEFPKPSTAVVVVSQKDPKSVSPLLGHLPGHEKKKKAEEKSVDSGQHSDEDSEVSGSEDVIVTPAGASRGSNNTLDVIETSKNNNAEISVVLKPSPAKGYTSWITKPPTPLKPKTKIRSASSGDLINEIPAEKVGGSSVDVRKLETKVALEMENTNELLSRAMQAQTPKDADRNPENLLSEALEKLKTADHVLREVRKLKLAKDAHLRKSW